VKNLAMHQSVIYNLIKEAINQKRELKMNIKYGLGDNSDSIEVEFQPYVLGSDIFQYSYVWGYLPHDDTYYKFLLNLINSVKASGDTYTVRANPPYPYALGEEHYASLLQN
jgi:hypothetical protein